MATRGAKPKPTLLRLVDGTHRTARHGATAAAKEAVEQTVAAFGKLERPKSLKGPVAAAWKRYIDPASWLDGSREAAAIAFCELWAEFQRMPAMFPASKHGQLRAYMAELGLTDERNRGDAGKDKSDEFFDD
jgi:hypothetical protein